MDEIDYTYECPQCGEAFCGSMPSDSREKNEDIVCEDCGHKYVLKVTVEVRTSTE